MDSTIDFANPKNTFDGSRVDESNFDEWASDPRVLRPSKDNGELGFDSICFRNQLGPRVETSSL